MREPTRGSRNPVLRERPRIHEPPAQFPPQTRENPRSAFSPPAGGEIPGWPTRARWRFPTQKAPGAFEIHETSESKLVAETPRGRRRTAGPVRWGARRVSPSDPAATNNQSAKSKASARTAPQPPARREHPQTKIHPGERECLSATRSRRARPRTGTSEPHSRRNHECGRTLP